MAVYGVNSKRVTHTREWAYARVVGLRHPLARRASEQRSQLFSSCSSLLWLCCCWCFQMKWRGSSSVMASAVHSIHPSIIIFNSCGLLAASCWITGEIDKTLSGWTLRVFIFHFFLVFLFFFIRYFFIYYFTRQEQQQTGWERERENGDKLWIMIQKMSRKEKTKKWNQINNRGDLFVWRESYQFFISFRLLLSV